MTRTIYRFNIGDIVESAVDHPQRNKSIVLGCRGVVVSSRNNGTGNVYGVQWDGEICDGHTCGGFAKDGHGWNVYENELRPVEVDETAIEVDMEALLKAAI